VASIGLRQLGHWNSESANVAQTTYTREKQVSMKKIYSKPRLKRLGLLRNRTHFSF
jgi:hypothetical protein